MRMARSLHRYAPVLLVRRVAVALVIAVVVIITLAGWRGLKPPVLEAYDAAVPVMRLHIVPNSNSADDQAMKLQVRDKLLPLVYELTDGVTYAEAEGRLLSHLEQLRRVATKEVRRLGSPYDVTIATDVDDRGEMSAVRVVIGAGAGSNWFCVLVPPLCFADLEAVERRPADGTATDGDIRFAWRWLGDLFTGSSLPVERVGQVDENDVDTDLAHAPPRDGDVGTTPE